MNAGTLSVLGLSLLMVSVVLTLLIISFKKGFYQKINNQAYIPFEDGDVDEPLDQIFNEKESSS